jgi:hypothetical protein
MFFQMCRTHLFLFIYNKIENKRDLNSIALSGILKRNSIGPPM